MAQILRRLGFGRNKNKSRLGVMSTADQSNSKLFDNFSNYFLKAEQKRTGHPIVGGDVKIDLTNYANF